MAYKHEERVIFPVNPKESYATICRAKMVYLQVADGKVEMQVNLYLKSNFGDQITTIEEKTIVISHAPNIVGEIIGAKLHNINIYDDGSCCEVVMDINVVTVGMALQL